MRQTKYKAQGFSLLEMMVAIAILAISLGTLYQGVSGATRNVRTDEKYAYGVELARSLLASNAMVPDSGLSERGETEGEFSWEVAAQPIAVAGRGLPRGVLQAIEVSVSWKDGGKRREVRLHSVVEGYPR
jgi:general secretion pathway protein I